uniref:Phosphatidic acid phosphatase type 2/haloperoxidase domain-containing protein n=1 Tax=Euplotes crassus TaxID=5936 RepID=A0A7S3NW47_EUPCR|mmetsp:Transcript_26294/g.26211  ORF Transcript_26294/g.26211 Transcript_26294/m.26211 type:complete len:173 (+) Transcript_26294:126-644(+)
MALSSATLVFDILLMVILAKTWGNRANVLIAYLTPVLLGNFVLKQIFQDPRPDLACSTTYGMPSGHSTAAGAIFITVMVLHQQHVISSSHFTLFYGLRMPLQAYSRIYLHYHTVRQVLVGFPLGAVFALVLYQYFPISAKKQEIPRKFVLNEIPEQYRLIRLQNEKFESLMV